jgi:hypothetical protein
MDRYHSAEDVHYLSFWSLPDWLFLWLRVAAGPFEELSRMYDMTCPQGACVVLHAAQQFNLLQDLVCIIPSASQLFVFRTRVVAPLATGSARGTTVGSTYLNGKTSERFATPSEQNLNINVPP